MKLLLAILIFMNAQTGAAAAYDAVLARLASLRAANPQHVTKVVIGRNDQGVEIEGILIAGAQAHADSPHSLVVGSHHGNERLSVDVALAVAEQAISAMTDPTSIYYPAMSTRILHVIPVLNIGGYNANRREEYDAKRVSHDPNRDYPDPCGGGGSKFKLASTDALARYMADQDIVAAVTIHGYIGTFTYPWGTYTNQTHTPDHAIYRTIAAKSGNISGYAIGTHADVIYPTNGAFEDWAYHSMGVWTMLLELDRGANVARDAESLVAYFAVAPTSRSSFHEHTGQCRAIDVDQIRARP